jgi:hypothetical protein
MILEMAGRRDKEGLGIALFVETIRTKAIVGVLVIGIEIEIVPDDGGASVGVIADAITADPGIKQGQGQKKEKEQVAFQPPVML